MYQDIAPGELRFALWSPMPPGTHLKFFKGEDKGKRGAGIVAVRETDGPTPWGRRYAEYLTEKGAILEIRDDDDNDFILVVGR